MKAHFSSRIASALAVVMLVAATAQAQDSNYWSIAYGTRSQLLGGVVVGSPGDISSTYYNPGALALAGPTEVLLAGNAYQYQRVSVQGGSGPGRDLISSSVGAVPSLFAGEIPVLDNDRIAYTFLTRRSMDMALEHRTTDNADFFAPIANPVSSALEIQLKQNFSETWYGMTWAHQLSPNLGFGVSPYVVVRSQTTRGALLTEGLDAAGNGAVLSASREFHYLHFSALARLGLSGRRDSLTWGVTVTTPNLQVMGSGNTQYNSTLVDQTGVRGTVMGADYEQDLDAHYKTPVGADVGASYGWGSTRIHAAVDWNGEVARYTVLEPDPFIVSTPSGDSTVHVVIDDRLDAVVNWGLGLEHTFNQKWAGYASYHSDYSARPESDRPSASITHWDLQHVTIGTTLKVKRSDFALGLSGAFAKQPTLRVPEQPAGTTPLQDLHTKVTFVTVVVGWKISF